MKRFANLKPIVIFSLGFCVALLLTIFYYQRSLKKDNNNVLKNEIQVSNSNSSKLPDSWTSCTSDSECAYLPNPCCPGWTAGAFNMSIVKNKSADTSACNPKPVECISAQPVTPSGNVIRPVCKNNKCSVEYENKNLRKPVRMGIPCKTSTQCPGPDGTCGKDGFCF